MRQEVFFMMTLACVFPSASVASDVVQAIRAEAPKTQLSPACQLLEQLNAEGGRVSKSTRAALVRARHEAKPDFLRARADASRKGLYGFRQDPNAALKLYLKAAEAKSPEAGFNAALLYFNGAGGRPDAATAQYIIQMLHLSTAANYNVSGAVYGQPNYLAGLVHEMGWTGTRNMKEAFLHYRASARNQYVPGIASYLRILSAELANLTEGERGQVLAEMRLMASRWKWSSAEIMGLVGDLHAAGWMPDKEGFNARMHWRIAARMGWQADMAAREGQLPTSQGGDRIERAVEAAIRSRDLSEARQGARLEFIDLCM